MSSILKALEKVEESKNARRAGGAAGLTRRRERRPAWLIPAWAVGGAAVASLVTFFAMGGFSRSSAPATSAVVPPAPSVAATQPPAAVVPPAPAVSASPAAVTPAVAPAPPAETAAPAAMKAASAPKPTTPLPAGKVSAPGAAKGAPGSKSVAASISRPAAKPAVAPVAVARPARAAIPMPAAKTSAPVAAPSLPAVAVAAPAPAVEEAPRQEIRVTGIAWQGSSESSFAMVNGRPIRHGGTVDGFKVDRIFEDSVRLTGSNGSVTVPLGAGE